MATKADQARAGAQKKGPSKKKAKKVAQRKPRKAHAEPIAAGRKATVAKEQTKGKRPSRKSTRASANRAKADSALEIRSELAKNAPTERARSDERKGTKVRGSG